MAKLMQDAASLLFSEQCMKEYFEDYNFLDVDCFKSTLSKALGFGVIAGSILVKVPQIIKILQSKSVKGINISSVLLDLFAITGNAAYSYVSGFPFSAWGDAVFQGIQTVIITLLILYHTTNIVNTGAFFAVYSAIIASVLMGHVPLHALWVCQGVNIPVILTGKMLQAYTNYSNGSTGQLSAATYFMLFFGSLARIFTSMQETGDTMMIVMYTCTTAANAVLVSQILYYWNADKVAVKEKKSK